MKSQIREEPKILAAAERQMQAWALTQEIEDRAVRQQGSRQLASVATTYVTISREAGAGGGEIARLVGEKLGWEVLDRNLLDSVAARFHLSRMMLDLVDETQSNWMYDVLGTWMDRTIIPQEKYVAHLTRVVLAAAQRGHCVFVGRGAQFLLPRDKALAVRIVAPEKFRIEQIMKRQRLDAAAARRCTDETDRGRHDFVQRFFHHDINDPHLYDLVINTERLGSTGAVDQIVAAVGEKVSGTAHPSLLCAINGS